MSRQFWGSTLLLAKDMMGKAKISTRNMQVAVSVFYKLYTAILPKNVSKFSVELFSLCRFVWLLQSKPLLKLHTM